MRLQLIDRKRVFLISLEIDDDLQHCGEDERVGSGRKDEKNTPVSKETKRKKPKK